MIKQGYSSAAYQDVYSQYGEIISGCVVRPIDNTEYYDIINVYPFDRMAIYNIPFAKTYKEYNLVSATLVSDPLMNNKHEFVYKREGLEVYKTHYIVDLQEYDFKNLPENHRRNIKRNEQNTYTGDISYLITEIVPDTKGYDSDMYQMYQTLVDRHSIRGFTNYSVDQFDKLLDVPGTVLFKTVLYRSDFHYPVRCNYGLFYIEGDDVYYHAGFCSNDGYKLNANFIMMHDAIKFFKRLGLNRLLLGSVPDGGSGGLKRFKEGFSTSTAVNYIVKHIYDKDAYDRLEKKSDRFPTYRS